jgi:hypothetical protein
MRQTADYGRDHGFFFEVLLIWFSGSVDRCGGLVGRWVGNKSQEKKFIRGLVGLWVGGLVGCLVGCLKGIGTGHIWGIFSRQNQLLLFCDGMEKSDLEDINSEWSI